MPDPRWSANEITDEFGRMRSLISMGGVAHHDLRTKVAEMQETIDVLNSRIAELEEAVDDLQGIR